MRARLVFPCVLCCLWWGEGAFCLPSCGPCVGGGCSVRLRLQRLWCGLRVFGERGVLLGATGCVGAHCCLHAFGESCAGLPADRCSGRYWALGSVFSVSTSLWSGAGCLSFGASGLVGVFADVACVLYVALFAVFGDAAAGLCDLFALGLAGLFLGVVELLVELFGGCVDAGLFVWHLGWVLCVWWVGVLFLLCVFWCWCAVG